jgi:hypothetical protein
MHGTEAQRGTAPPNRTARSLTSFPSLLSGRMANPFATLRKGEVFSPFGRTPEVIEHQMACREAIPIALRSKRLVRPNESARSSYERSRALWSCMTVSTISSST